MSVLLPFDLFPHCSDLVAFYHIHSQTVDLPHGPLPSPTLMNRVALLATSFKGGRALHSSVKSSNTSFP